MTVCVSSSLVLPSHMASSFRGLTGTFGGTQLDVRSIVPAKQLVEGYKTCDCLIISGNEWVFICSPVTGDISRYFRWESVTDIHWHPELQTAAMVCEDGFNFVAFAFGGGAQPQGGQAGGGLDTHSSLMTTTTAFSSAFASQSLRSEARSTPTQNDAVRAPPSGSEAPQGKKNTESSITRAFQRVRGASTVFNKNKTSSTSSSGSVTAWEMHTASSPQPKAHAAYTEAADASLLLPVSKVPTTLSELVMWSTALSKSRYDHGVNKRCLTLHTHAGAHLNAWDTYCVRRPANYSLTLPIVTVHAANMSSSDSNRLEALRRYYANDFGALQSALQRRRQSTEVDDALLAQVVIEATLGRESNEGRSLDTACAAGALPSRLVPPGDCSTANDDEDSEGKGLDAAMPGAFEMTLLINGGGEGGVERDYTAGLETGSFAFARSSRERTPSITIDEPQDDERSRRRVKAVLCSASHAAGDVECVGDRPPTLPPQSCLPRGESRASGGTGASEGSPAADVVDDEPLPELQDSFVIIDSYTTASVTVTSTRLPAMDTPPAGSTKSLHTSQRSPLSSSQLRKDDASQIGGPSTHLTAEEKIKWWEAHCQAISRENADLRRQLEDLNTLLTVRSEAAATHALSRQRLLF